MPDCPWEPCWPHWGCVLLGEPLLRLLRGAACPPPGPARGPGRAAAAIRLCLPHRPSLPGPVGSLGQSGSPRGQSQQDVHTERQMYFKEVAVWLRRPASPKSAGGLAGWGPGGAGSSCLIGSESDPWVRLLEPGGSTTSPGLGLWEDCVFTGVTVSVLTKATRCAAPRAETVFVSWSCCNKAP